MTDLAKETPPGPAISLTSLPTARDRQSLWFGATGNPLYQFARYGVVGGLAFVIDFGSLYLLTELAGLHYLISAAVAFVLGLCVNYSLCRLWVFDRRTMKSVGVEFLVFAVIGIVGLGLNEVIMWFVHEIIYYHYLVAKLISAGVVFGWNFGARKSVLFH